MAPFARGFALWILTKFAMLFFIFALAAILLQMSVTQQAGACATQAGDAASGITAKISQVIFSPSEDERQTYSLVGALPVGSGGVRYGINVTYRVLASANGNAGLYITLGSFSEVSCNAGTNIGLGEPGAYTVVFVSPAGMQKAVPGSILRLTPSEGTEGLKKSRYVIILKCAQKSPGGDKYLFIQDCHQESLADCSELGFDSATVKTCCGWDPAACPIG
ncbi:MAG: hypothetical protein WCX64_03135 [Candidatus Micrarchaeia archaeon]